MSRESRDGRKPHESDDDVRSNHSADQNDQNDQDEEQSEDESARLGAVASA